MVIRERRCAQCGGQFRYQTGRGKDRRYCGPDCRDDAKRVKRAQAVRASCSIEGCEHPRRSPGSAMCEMHYYRVRRNGTLETVTSATPVLAHTGGYVLVYAPDHPLCTPRHPHVYEHRKVFYDQHGEGPFPCHWCGVTVAWGDNLHVDHLNEVKDDNAPGNLVASCPTCNMNRGRPGWVPPAARAREARQAARPGA